MSFSFFDNWFWERHNRKVRRREAQLLRTHSQFAIGDNIFVPEKEAIAIIESMEWHYKENEPMFFLSFGGKESSRRYWTKDIQKIPS